ncbi:efflux RND transporter periplasmic adaptor subunit [Luteibacter sp. 22Crub2.1]|uniref:efflux RND transporter periplasmic adaptor subunit n=1 Tax=Luteibacter sp. 22Crub2.1 TaxID=1283288 RepID=UPI0009A7977B|nr:efflux RND transporter periplasmic adaptor subunit [Luteibacter sp. 22Crub2.1]SKB95989.1 RND family efflux transporter, MFP subunit [Luteibacter sp. 22Crub2.1]
MSRYLLCGVIVVATFALGGCSAGTDSSGDGVTPSAVIRQVMPARARFEDRVVAYGQGAAGIGGSRVLALPLDASLTNVDVVAGQQVHRGQRLAAFSPSAAAAAARVTARSNVAVAREQRDRMTRLLADHLATNDQISQAEKTLRDAEAAYAAQATPDDTLRAPVDGTVLTVDAARGALVTAGATLMTFAEGQRLGFAGGIEPRDMARVHVGDAVTIRPLSDGMPVAARISAVADAVDPASRLVTVQALAPTPLIQGEAYRAEIVVGSLEGWRVPADAVVGDDGARAVWQVVRGKAHRIPVTIVAAQGDDVLVDGEIDASRAIATVGAPQLEEGTQVRPAGSK